MKKARIPPKLLLDAMMHQLGLPNAVYSTQKGRTVSLDATIHFYGCKQDLNNGFPRKSMTIPVYGNLEKTEDQLAAEALKCMETTYSTVLQDLNYNKLQLVQEKCNTLEHQLEEKDGMINYFSNLWYSSLSGDRMAAKELYRIIDTNFTAGSTSKDNDLNHILSQVRYVADHLNDTPSQSMIFNGQMSIIGPWMIIPKEFLLWAMRSTNQSHCEDLPAKQSYCQNQ